MLEWKIDNVMARKRALPASQAVRSGFASVRGVELQFDWFPNGNGQKIYAPGVCALRIYAPPCTNIKFEVTLGTYCDGVRDWDTEMMDLWFDVFFPDWEESIARDAITFKVDIKANMNDDIGSSGQQAVRLYNSAEDERLLAEKKEQEMIRRQKENERLAVATGDSPATSNVGVKEKRRFSAAAAAAWGDEAPSMADDEAPVGITGGGAAAVAEDGAPAIGDEAAAAAPAAGEEAAVTGDANAERAPTEGQPNKDSSKGFSGASYGEYDDDNEFEEYNEGEDEANEYM